MQFYAFLATIWLFVASACAFEGLPLQVSNVTLTVDKVATGNVSLTFSVFNPDPASNASSTCSGSWPYRSRGWPEDTYASCKSNNFGWNMAGFTGYNRFALGIQHRFNDPAFGDPPNDSVTIYGKAKVNKQNLDCESDDKSVSCEQKMSKIDAPIYAQCC